MYRRGLRRSPNSITADGGTIPATGSADVKRRASGIVSAGSWSGSRPRGECGWSPAGIRGGRACSRNRDGSNTSTNTGGWISISSRTFLSRRERSWPRSAGIVRLGGPPPITSPAPAASSTFTTGTGSSSTSRSRATPATSIRSSSCTFIRGPQRTCPSTAGSPGSTTSASTSLGSAWCWMENASWFGTFPDTASAAFTPGRSSLRTNTTTPRRRRDCGRRSYRAGDVRSIHSRAPISPVSGGR